MLLSSGYTTLIIKSKSKQPNPSIASYYYDINIKKSWAPTCQPQPASQPPHLSAYSLLVSQLMKLWPDSGLSIGTLLHLESPPPLWAGPLGPSLQHRLGGPVSLPRLAIPPLHMIRKEPSNSSFRNTEPTVIT